jgi:hypothetical protein
MWRMGGGGSRKKERKGYVVNSRKKKGGRRSTGILPDGRTRSSVGHIASSISSRNFDWDTSNLRMNAGICRVSPPLSCSIVSTNNTNVDGKCLSGTSFIWIVALHDPVLIHIIQCWCRTFLARLVAEHEKFRTRSPLGSLSFTLRGMQHQSKQPVL